VPSLLTSAALFSGFYSIIYTVNSVLYHRDEYRNAVIAIILATFFDSLDGRMARLMKAESEFGSHFDSIADMVSFGVAPSVLLYASALSKLGRLGWLAAFLFLACAAIRLARFNVISHSAPSRKYFKGLSSPVAAGGAVLFSLLFREYAAPSYYEMGVCGMTMLLALLMVSNVRFRSFKDLDFRKHPLQVFLLAVLIIIMIASFGESAMFAFFLMYLIGGLIEELVLFRRRRKSDPSVPFLPFGDRDL